MVLKGFLAAFLIVEGGSPLRIFFIVLLALKKTSSGASVHEMTCRCPPLMRVIVAIRLGKDPGKVNLTY